MIIIPVAMLHGIIDSLRQGDENIRVQVGVYFKPVHKLLDKLFDFLYAAGIRGQFQYVSIIGDGEINSFS